MRPALRPCLAAALAVFLLSGAAGPVAAQAPATPEGYQQVVSANPFGLLLGWFNAEYERIVTPASTAGFGGSTFSNDDERYVNADIFWRFYPAGTPFEGWTMGAKAGITSVEDRGTYFGFGFDANYSWMLGANENFYVGVGIGLKRIVGTTGDEVDLKFIPTVRLVNIGFAF